MGGRDGEDDDGVGMLSAFLSTFCCSFFGLLKVDLVDESTSEAPHTPQPMRISLDAG